MSNNYFQFKQFTIHQERCAMKVCTDACLFGAYIARELFGRQLAPGNILDIGTGTGLLSLMVAQKTNGIIDAIEIDGAAAQQAKQNFEQSPWNNRLNIFKTDALLFNPGKKYDCIISNPPFFEGDLKSGNKKRNAAKHDTTFTLEQLLSVIGRHLLPHGFFGILLPCQRVNLFVEIATAAHYFLNGQLLIQHTGGHQFFRGILFFSHHNTTIIRNELAIKDENGNYTHNFIELLEDYYLNL
ncbi:MAG: methyltransferase [Ferruginibacter sp.]|nr:methyltransferase [Ferruginibacter sp.]